MNKLSNSKRAQILEMLVEGMSMRAASRIAKVSINTVTKLMVEAGEACAAYHDKAVRNVTASKVQCDEIWAFCYAKEKNVARAKNAALAATLIEETCLKQGIEPQVLTLHSDRGAPMTSKCTAQLLADLGVTRSLSRPQVSDDNPFSEAQFKTLKYHPGFPGRFEDITAAIAFCRSFFPWYNTEHRHAGIAMLTPADVHHHRAPDVLAQRGRTLQAAWALHPERFVHGTPKPAPLPEAVWINPPATSTKGETSQ